MTIEEKIESYTSRGYKVHGPAGAKGVYQANIPKSGLTFPITGTADEIDVVLGQFDRWEQTKSVYELAGFGITPKTDDEDA
jgi:hypothetical protein